MLFQYFFCFLQSERTLVYPHGRTEHSLADWISSVDIQWGGYNYWHLEENIPILDIVEDIVLFQESQSEYIIEEYSEGNYRILYLYFYFIFGCEDIVLLYIWRGQTYIKNFSA